MCRGEALQVLQLLDAEAQAGQRADVFALRDAVADFACLSEQLVAVAHARPGVQSLVCLVDAVEAGLHQLDRGELLRPYRFGKLVRWLEVEF